VEAFGKVDILVNNAGITRDDLIMRMPIEDWKKVLEVNLFGAFYMIKAGSADAQGSCGRYQHVERLGQAGQMVSQLLVVEGWPHRPDQGTAREVASRGITCNAVAPGSSSRN